jgi:hypothetical protein
MADPKVVRGTLGGVTVQTSEETAALLGSSFEAEKATASKKATSSDKSSK